MTSYVPFVSRRVTLGWLTAALSVAQLPRQAAASPIPAQGYGIDPQLDHYVVPWPRLLSRTQLAQLAVLADLILPADEQAPAPSALGIPDFLDEWISAPYPIQVQDRTTIIDGLASLNREAIRRGAAGWTAASPAQRNAIIAGIAAPGDTPVAAADRRFFPRVRSLVVGAYYTTDKGMAAIGYVGNVALEAYPPVGGALETELQARMRALGLS